VGGVKAAGAYGWQPYHFHVPIVLKSRNLNHLEPSGPVQACNGIALPLLTKVVEYHLTHTGSAHYKSKPSIPLFITCAVLTMRSSDRRPSRTDSSHLQPEGSPCRGMQTFRGKCCLTGLIKEWDMGL